MSELSEDQWQEHGACRKTNPALFYAPENEGSHQRRFRESAAKAICAHCPVRALCRTYALQAGELYGIWGGTTERERQGDTQTAARTRRPKQPAAAQRSTTGPERRPSRRASAAASSTASTAVGT